MEITLKIKTDQLGNEEIRQTLYQLLELTSKSETSESKSDHKETKQTSGQSGFKKFIDAIESGVKLIDTSLGEEVGSEQGRSEGEKLIEMFKLAGLFSD